MWRNVVECLLFAGMVTSATQARAAENVLPADTSGVRVKISGVGEVPFDDVIKVSPAQWSVKVAGPNGHYTVTWVVEVKAAAAMKLKADLFQWSAGQKNRLQMGVEGAGTECYMANDHGSIYPHWQARETALLDPVWYVDMQKKRAGKEPMKLRFRWTFVKVGQQHFWETRLKNVSVEATPAEELLREFRRPMAEGFPQVALPPAEGITDKVRWKIVDKVLMRDGEPFFPVGFVFGTDDRTLGQVRGMGATAVHSTIPWPGIMKKEGAADQDALEDYEAQLKRIGRWGIAALPLMEGHYVPDWFSAKHPQDKTWPLGSDGNKTGSWFPYSIHYRPLRSAMKDFWTATGQVMRRCPATLAVITWNECVYGGNDAHARVFADYRDFAIENYRKWLAKEYGTVAALNKHWGTDHAKWSDINPPRSPDEINRRAWFDWARYGQIAFAGFFQYCADVFHKAAPDLWMIHKPTDYPFDDCSGSSGINYYLLARSSPNLFGFDAYTSTPAIVALARGCADNKPVFQLETNTTPPDAAHRNPQRVRSWMWQYMMGGLRGMFIFCMTSGQYGMLNDAFCNAQTRPAYAEFVQQVGTYGHILALADAPPKIAVIHSTASVLHYPGQRPVYPGPAFGAYHLIKNSHYNLDFLPQEKCTLKNMSAYKVIVVPSYTILSDAQTKALQRFVNRGGNLLAFSHSLEKNIYFEDLPEIPRVLGLKSREAVEGSAVITVTDPAIATYVPDTLQAKSGIERITASSGRILARAGDAPVVVTAGKGKVVYCAFSSDSGCERLVEGILRELFGIKQTVRLVAQGDRTVAYNSALIRLIRAPGRRGRHHLLVFNDADKVTLSLDTDLKFTKEHFYGADGSLPAITLSSSHAYLLSEATVR